MLISGIEETDVLLGIEVYKSDRLFDECVDVERNIETGKVDHSPNFHKDVLDAVCGATYNASKNAEQYAFEYGEDIENILATNNSSQNPDLTQITVDFENELKGVFSGIEKSTSDKAKDLDFGFGPAVPLTGNYISQGIMLW